MRFPSWLKPICILAGSIALANSAQAGSTPDNGYTPGWLDTTVGRHFLRNTHTSGTPDLDYVFRVGSQTLVKFYGDWDGNGSYTPGYFDPAVNVWYLKNSHSDPVFSPPTDLRFIFGVKTPPIDTADLIPVVGDFDGNGTYTVGFFDRLTNRWFLRNTNSGGTPDLDFVFGVKTAPTPVSVVPVLGDWDGMGGYSVGFFDTQAFRWFLRNANSNGAPNDDFVFSIGQAAANVRHVTGDFDGDGTSTIGYVVLTANRWILRNSNSGGMPDENYIYGVMAAPPPATLIPCAGDWDGLQN